MLLLASCAPGSTPSPGSIEAARAGLRDLITDVTAATAYRYQLADDRGRSMGPTDIIWVPEAGRFAAVYFTLDEGDQAFHVQLATSADLMEWTWVVELADLASQPTIAAASDGGYVVAWEQEPDPIHMVIASFATWDDLRAGTVARRFDVPVTMPACGEGTPSIDAATGTRVDLGFHYHADCVRDREASGSTDWTTWQAIARPERDKALIDLGVAGHIGDRDSIVFGGHTLIFIDGQLVLDDFGSWRTFLYDEETRSAEQLNFHTHKGSKAFSSLTVGQVMIGGHEAILVTLFLMGDGTPSPEDGTLVYYRTLPDGTE